MREVIARMKAVRATEANASYKAACEAATQRAKREAALPS